MFAYGGCVWGGPAGCILPSVAITCIPAFLCILCAYPVRCCFMFFFFCAEMWQHRMNHTLFECRALARHSVPPTKFPWVWVRAARQPSNLLIWNFIYDISYFIYFTSSTQRNVQVLRWMDGWSCTSMQCAQCNAKQWQADRRRDSWKSKQRRRKNKNSDEVEKKIK